jgi:hypothetical protein
MAGETLHSHFAKTFDFRYADMGYFVVGMTDPSIEWKMVAPPHLSNKRMTQQDEVGPLVCVAIFSPILLGLGISRFGDLFCRAVAIA